MMYCTYCALPILGTVLTTVFSPSVLTMTFLRQMFIQFTDEEQAEESAYDHSQRTEKWGVQIQVSQNSKLLLLATILLCLCILGIQKTNKKQTSKKDYMRALRAALEEPRKVDRINEMGLASGLAG